MLIKKGACKSERINKNPNLQIVEGNGIINP